MRTLFLGVCDQRLHCADELSFTTTAHITLNGGTVEEVVIDEALVLNRYILLRVMDIDKPEQ